MAIHPFHISLFISIALRGIQISADETDVDFDGPVLIRMERDYGGGGPLAKGKPNAASVSSEAPASAALPGNTAMPSGSTGSSGASGSGKGDCAITVVAGSVLPEIGSNTAQLPDFNLKYSDTCKTISECTKLCEKAACNYFIRSGTNNEAKFYSVTQSKLSSPNYVESMEFDSFLPQCPFQEKQPQLGSGNGTGGTPVDRCPECTLKDQFKRFLQNNNKSYNPYEEERRYKIFQDNAGRVAELQKSAQPGDANFTLTKFSDLTFGEFLQTRTGGIKEEEPADVFEEDIGVVPGVPPRFNWADEGVVPEPRDQHDCGSCYAFSTSDLVGTQWAIDHGERNKSYVLAPQVVLDCIRAPAAFGCNGGRPFLVLSTNANCTDCPWPRETCYPYENKANDQCATETKTCVHSDTPLIHVSNAHYLDLSKKGEKERVAALLQAGPIVALVTITDHWQFYSGGIMRATQCTNASESPNHAILITGYDYTGPVPAYIIKNSWAKDWGEGGYFRLEAGTNTCGIAKFMSFACTADCGGGKSARNLIDRAIKRQQERGFGTTPAPLPYGGPAYPPAPAPTGYAVLATFPPATSPSYQRDPPPPGQSAPHFPFLTIDNAAESAILVGPFSTQTTLQPTIVQPDSQAREKFDSNLLIRRRA